MSKKHNKKQRVRRRVRNCEGQPDGRPAGSIKGSGGKTYDTEMIRDYLDQLLVELRAQHRENVFLLKVMEKHEDADAACKAAFTNHDTKFDVEHVKYVRKYSVHLLQRVQYDERESTTEEICTVLKACLPAMIQKRKEQIDHLESLKEAFDESLECAKNPLSVKDDWMLLTPSYFISIREEFDKRFG